MSLDYSDIGRALDSIRANKPLIHHITNYVVMNETANATLALGALPVMAHAAEEVEEMVGLAGSLVLNIGTLYPELVESMLLAGKEANRREVPVVLDPVGAGATSLRTRSALRILDQVQVAIIRANAGEAATLVGAKAEVRGVESIGVEGNLEEFCANLARERKCTVAITGPVDTISDGKRLARVFNGHPLLGGVTGTGCMCTTMVAGFAAVSTDAWAGAVGGLVTFGIAGEIAAARSGEKRPGTFHVELYNALAEVSANDIADLARFEISEV